MAVSWIEELNPAQREAVEHGEGPLLVVAGAGTGKTKTLACRVAHLIGKGVRADRILLLTFTRRAAGEMISRVRHMVETTEVAGVWSGTFHSVANRLLRIYGRAIDLSPEFTVMDQADAADMMNLIRNDLGCAKGKKRFARKQTLVKIYSHTVNAQKPLSEVVERYFPWCAEDLEAFAAIFQEYTQRKRRHRVLDYDDLLLYWRMLCATLPTGKTVADRFDHVLVDEYQDTNAIQSEIVRAMRVSSQNVMAVGDDAQSIYSFRAATVRNILDFPEAFPGTHVVTLEENYRSTKPILAASNAVMQQAKERYTKELRSDRESGEKPVLYICQDEAEQCEVVCGTILEHREQGIDLMQQAVLFRASHHSAQLEVELTRRNIPFHKYGGLKFIEAAHIKDMLAILRIIENPYDELSWFRVLQLLDGVGPRTAHKIMTALTGGPAADTEAGVATPLRRLFAEPPTAPSAAREQFAGLRSALADCVGVKLNGASPEPRASARADDRSPDAPDAPRGSVPLPVQVERVRRFYEPICEAAYENPKPRLRDIEQLELIAARYRSRGRFITDLTLDPPTSTSDLAGAPHLDEDYLILSTIHSAKGCEWTSVHIIHAADGMIPSDMATTDEAGIEEERRLLYVAMTRAKDHLLVHFPLRYYHTKHRRGDGHSFAQLSRYLDTDVMTYFQQKAAVEPSEPDPTKPADREQLDDWLNKLWTE